jgi:hypothetical protein
MVEVSISRAVERKSSMVLYFCQAELRRISAAAAVPWA